MRKRDREFWESACKNKGAWMQYYQRLVELSMSMFKWENLPSTVDERYLELCLLTDGQAVFFFDEVLGALALRCATGGNFSVYHIPNDRRAFASNGYNRKLNEKNSVLIYNNMLHTNSMLDIEIYAQRLWDMDRTIDINAKAQKTPIIILCDESQRLTMENLYKKYDGNVPFIFGEKGLDINAVKTINTNAPFIAPALYDLRTQIWNEALTVLGISNINVTKKERMITDEVKRNQGGTLAMRYSKLNARNQACNQINEMFGDRLDAPVRCVFREDMIAKEQLTAEEKNDTEDGEDYE